MNYKEPTKEQLELMQNYSNICSEAIDLILKCETSPILRDASVRIQESMGHFHNYVINGGKLSQEN
jgi:hypothetical protein